MAERAKRPVNYAVIVIREAELPISNKFTLFKINIFTFIVLNVCYF